MKLQLLNKIEKVQLYKVNVHKNERNILGNSRKKFRTFEKCVTLRSRFVLSAHTSNNLPQYLLLYTRVNCKIVKARRYFTKRLKQFGISEISESSHAEQSPPTPAYSGTPDTNLRPRGIEERNNEPLFSRFLPVRHPALTRRRSNL